MHRHQNHHQAREQFDPWGKFSVDSNEKQLIEGPRSPLRDMRRLFKILFEFVKGFHTFRHLPPCVTFFGSARFQEDHPYYELARVTARLVAHSGFTIMTGGGPGIMEAANRGAKDVNGGSVGCNITLPVEQKPNNYLDKFVELNHFYVRRVMLLRYSYAFVVLPGGFGTLDEIFETLTLMQTGKISNFPIFMMGTEFWLPLRNFIFDTLEKNATISNTDRMLLNFTDDPHETMAGIKYYAENTLGFKWTRISPITSL